MTKIVFCFAGTGDSGDQYAEHVERYSKFNKDVIRVYLRGCQHSEIGDGFLFPDLDIAASKIRKAFDGNHIDLLKLKTEFGDGICLIIGPQDLENKVAVEGICLQGFSRGAVTAFATGIKLNDLGVPIDIIANQPVPGQMQMILFLKTLCVMSMNITIFISPLQSSHKIYLGMMAQSILQKILFI